MIEKASVNRAKEAIKKGRETGRVLHYSKAFEMHPVQEEWHKGKLENVLNYKGENDEV